MPFLDRIRCFEALEISVHSFSKNFAKINISLDNREKFTLEYKYDHEVELNENLAGLMGATAVINYALFTGEIIFDFPTSESDRKMIEEMVKINNIEVFINRLCRIRYHFLSTRKPLHLSVFSTAIRISSFPISSILNLKIIWPTLTFSFRTYEENFGA